MSYYYQYFRYAFENNSWGKLDIELNNKIAYAASITILNGTVWWVTGGFTGGTAGIKTTEMLKIDNGNIVGKLNNSPDLPIEMNGHCMARVDNDRVFIAGGNTNDAFIYNELHGNYTELPDVEGRINTYGAACSTVSLDGTLMLIIIGGSSYGINDPGEMGVMYDMTNCSGPVANCQGDWIYDNKMLHGLGSFIDGAYVTYNDERGLVLSGGNINVDEKLDLSNRLLNFNETSGSFRKLPLIMKQKRQGHSAVIIPNGDITCS